MVALIQLHPLLSLLYLLTAIVTQTNQKLLGIQSKEWALEMLRAYIAI